MTTTAFSTAIAISAIVMFFSLQFNGIEVDWVGNARPYAGVDAEGPVRLQVDEERGYFGPGVGEF